MLPPTHFMLCMPVYFAIQQKPLELWLRFDTTTVTSRSVFAEHMKFMDSLAHKYFYYKKNLIFSSHYSSMCRYQISVSSDSIMPYCLIFKNPYWVTNLSFPHITKIIQEHLVLGWDRIFNNFPSSTAINYPQFFIKCLGLCEEFPFTLACQQVWSCHVS